MFHLLSGKLLVSECKLIILRGELEEDKFDVHIKTCERGFPGCCFC